jgi:hypothetical protein
MRPTRPLVLAALALVGVTPAAASAHDLRAKVTVTAAEVRVEAGYDDDTPADGAKVSLAAADGTTVASGTLDATGRWSTPAPPPGTFTVVVNDFGHRDRVAFTIDSPTADAPAEATFTGWRLDKTLGLVAGLVLLLGGTLVYVVVRRPAA